MMEKDTSKLVEELKLCPDFERFYDENQESMVSGTLVERLEELRIARGLTRRAVIVQAEMSEDYGYQIFNGLRRPDRGKLLALTVGMGLTLEETQGLLKCADYPPLFIRRPWDSVVLYGICKRMTVPQINELLFQYGLNTLG